MTERLIKTCCFCFELTDVFRLDTFEDGAHDGSNSQVPSSTERGCR
ncbi:MAG: hypothetical protein AB7L13_10160 [Acidimicrobiia bacterium]